MMKGYTTIQKICEDIPQVNANGKVDIAAVRRGEEVPSVAEGLKPKRPPQQDGMRHDFTPEELLSLRVRIVSVNGAVKGYQRMRVVPHLRKMAAAMVDGRRFPDIQVAIDRHGNLWIVDGQHRAIAAVIARRSIKGVMDRLTPSEEAQLFSDQDKKRSVDRNVTILSGDSPYYRYIQAAVASSDHPWGQIVSASPNSKTRISPNQMLGLLTYYVGDSMSYTQASIARWDEARADEMAPLIACFGNKQTNPDAFKRAQLAGIGQASMYIFRRHPFPHPGDRERWIEQMPRFNWADHPQARTQKHWTWFLVQHWNRKLQGSRRVDLFRETVAA